MFKPLPQSVTNAQYAFLAKVEGLLPTNDELNNWLITLPVSSIEREQIRALGPLANWTAQPYAWSFREYVTDRRALLMVDYMAEHLSIEDYAAWVDFHGQGEGKILRVLATRPQ
jgi:hypothetical protein